ncbi:hypothetical protein PJF56_18205 [Roseofilum sp. BLCC_M91]|uniref:Uncharacterized protein n=1 Tax=Roseofilum halophilum BLCC-M91 TaxID=3022259 RepID=A0ABT7BNM8_9CYAN|nr:hypothetical protein [Roseofilum halophilum]MDJ1180796.1 hypothetical protein [Roseofilum halophilum BLCC-M91]
MSGIKKYARGFTQAWKDQQKTVVKQWDNWLGRIGNALGRAWQGLSGGIWNGLKWLAGAVGFGAGTVIRWITQSVQYLWRFNWNLQDEEIDAQIESDLLALSGQLGGGFGASIGWVVCGGVGGAVLAKIDPAMAAAVAAELGEEAKEELVQVWTQVGMLAFDIAATNAFKQTFKFARRLMKKQEWAKKVFGAKYTELIENWGKPGGEVISLAKWKNDRIEEIPNEYIRTFVEEFFEEFGDSCNEAIMVIANGIDSYQALQSTTIQDQVLGQDMIVEVTPNKAEGEEYRFYGKENLVRQQTTSFLAQYQMMYGKDIGQYVGEPAPQYQMKKIHTVSAVILWQSKVTPPLRVKGEKFKTSTLTIPDLKKTGITWRGLQKAAGNYQGFVAGPSRFWVKMSCGAQTTLWAESEEIAEKIVKDLMGFSASEIVAESGGTQKKTHRQNKNNRNYKERIRVYPYSVTFFRTGADKTGRVRLLDSRDEAVSRRSLKLPLWQKLDNPQYDKEIKEFLTAAFADIPREF